MKMKIRIILVFGGLIILPLLGLAQTSDNQVVPTKPTDISTTTRQESAQIFPPKETETPVKCGISILENGRECGVGLYTRSYIQCYDGYQPIIGDDSSCKSVEVWSQFTKDVCINRCSAPQSSDEPPTTPAIPETAVPTPTYSCNNNGICDANIGETTTNCEKDCLQPTTTSTATTPGGNTRGGGGAISTTSTPPGTSAPTTTATSPDAKCGLNTSKVYNECGAGVYKNAYAQCYSGFEITLGETTSCKPAELWEQYAKEACASHCSSRNGSGVVSTPSLPQPTESTPIFYYKDTGEGGNRLTPLEPSSVPVVEREWVSVCTTIDTLTQNYNETVLELQKQEALSSKEKIEDLTRSLENLKKYTEDAKKICSTDPQMAWRVAAPPKGIKSTPIYTQESKQATQTTKPVEIPKATPVCYISDYLFQKYNLLIIELQKSESDKTRTELMTKEIIALKQQISTQQKECVSDSSQSTPTVVSWPAPTPAPQSIPTGSPIAIENKSIPALTNKPVAVEINRCNEVVQWETKILYYKKLGNLNEDELKKNGFSREEIEKIIQELLLGIEKVRAQCTSQEKTPVITKATAITGSASIAETVRPVVIGSGQEIGTYYKAKLEKVVSAKGEKNQIEELKTLRDEIDELISNLIKSRKELEVSELDTLVKEVKVSRGEIKADDISVKTTEKKMLVNIGDRSVSVEPAENQVIIRDKGLEVNTNEVTIKENVLSVGGVDVKMSASEVSENLGLTPTTIELKEDNGKAVYNMEIDEHLKLFGIIPFNSQRVVIADAENGNTLSEQHPWYSFLTTK